MLQHEKHWTAVETAEEKTLPTPNCCSILHDKLQTANGGDCVKTCAVTVSEGNRTHHKHRDPVAACSRFPFVSWCHKYQKNQKRLHIAVLCTWVQ